MRYYDNPDRIVIGVDVTTLTDVFEEMFNEYSGGKEIDWDIFNEMSRDFDLFVENNFSQKFGGHKAVAESYDDDSYTLTFWGDKNNPSDVQALKKLSDECDDHNIDNGTAWVNIYDTNVYAGDVTSFLDKWGAKGDVYGVMAEALVDSVVVEVSFPEEYFYGD